MEKINQLIIQIVRCTEYINKNSYRKKHALKRKKKVNRKKKVGPSHRPKPRSPKLSFDMGPELNQAQKLHSQGHLAEAEGIYKKILARYPDHPDTLHFLGIIAIQVGKNEIAVNLIQSALVGTPQNPIYLSNIGNALKALDRQDEALASYRKAIRIKPDFADAHYNMATIFQTQGKMTEALRSYKNALRFKPNFANAHTNIGTILQADNRLSEAIERYQTSLELHPGNAETLNNLGMAFHKIGNLAQAMVCFEDALKIHPDFTNAHYNMGNARYTQGDLNGAISAFQRALEIQPDHANAYYNLGTVHQELNKLDTAGTCFKKAITLQPQHFTACNNLGNTLIDLGRPAEALSYLKKAIEIKPDFADAYNNKGNALEKMGEIEQARTAFLEACQIDPKNISARVNLGLLLKNLGQADAAIANFEKVLELEPEMPDALSHLTHQFMHVCDWKKALPLSDRLDALTQRSLESGTRPAETPFISISQHANPALNYSVARSWSAEIERKTANLIRSFPSRDMESNSQKLTIGYLSNNFRNHPMAHIMLGLFRLHDRSAFNIICYSSGQDDGSFYRKQIETDCDRFVDLRHMTTLDAARLINRDRVDILVDLMGHTHNDSLDISSLRPAQIQSRYLGLAGTTGADFFDYIIADRIVIPKEDMPFYSEKPVWLPHCYQINDRDQTVSNKKWHRSEFGLQDDVFIFCSFNTSYKIDPVIFDTWMRILLKVPNSILWLLSKNRTTEDNLKKAAQAKGVSPEKLHFAKKLPKDQHLARIGLADLILDTRIVGGAASTSDALWAGVPVVTMTGTHFASRMSTSILTAINLPDLITENIAEYEALAIKLAQNSRQLESIKHRLSENQLTTPLFDTLRFVRNLETAYQMMWDIHAKGDAPRPIKVTAPRP